MNNEKILDKSKFTLVQQDKVIYDEKIETEPIGYFKDAWIRFRKNKVSVLAFIILMIIFFFTLFGPYLNSYSFNDKDVRIATLPPRIPGIEKLGIFDGTKVYKDYTMTRYTQIPEDIVISTSNVHTKPRCDGNPYGDVCYKNGVEIPWTYTTFMDIKVDDYKYRNWINSHDEKKYLTLSQSQFEEVDPSIIIGTPEEISAKMVRYVALDENGVEKEYIVSLETFSSIDPDTVISEEHYTRTMYKLYVDYWQYMGYEEGEMPYFWFGTDQEGRDLFTSIWIGTRTSFIVSFTVATINIMIGIVLGAICGYYGGKVDLYLQRIFEIVSEIPLLAVLTILILRFGSTMWVVVLAFTLTGWVGTSRMVRAQFYRYKNREYVLAARSLGASDVRIMARHIFPNALGMIITSTVLQIPFIIFTESNFSFLSIINYGTTTSLGRIISYGQEVMNTSVHILLFPGIIISLLMLSFNMFGNGLRDAFNPSLRGVEE
ncbi:ABC transporter permease [Mycoplasmatota bacterium]|nr:ABC transporter permease [Mycoplasmatota bacterium]